MVEILGKVGKWLLNKTNDLGIPQDQISLKLQINYDSFLSLLKKDVLLPHEECMIAFRLNTEIPDELKTKDVPAPELKIEKTPIKNTYLHTEIKKELVNAVSRSKNDDSFIKQKVAEISEEIEEPTNTKCPACNEDIANEKFVIMDNQKVHDTCKVQYARFIRGFKIKSVLFDNVKIRALYEVHKDRIINSELISKPTMEKILRGEDVEYSSYKKFCNIINIPITEIFTKDIKDQICTRY